VATFRGVVKGSRSSCSRLGTRESGLTVIAQTESGELHLDVWRRTDGSDAWTLTQRDNTHCPSGLRTETLASGTVGESVCEYANGMRSLHTWRERESD